MNSYTQPVRRRRRPRPVRVPRPKTVDALAALAGIGLGFTIGFDIASESARGLSAAGGMMTAAGRMTGMIGTYALLMLVLVIGRIPALERVIGQDRLVIWHRRLAPVALILLVAHAFLITIGYAQASGSGALYELWKMVTTMSGMLTALVGTVLLVAAGVTSYRFARRRMKYETWWIIHLYTYLAIALAYSHQLATGTPFIGHPFARAFWISIYLLTVGVVVLYRILLPLGRSLRHQLKVVAVHQEAPGVVSIICSGRRLDRLPVAGGQFMQWRFLKPGLWWQAHPYSLSAMPTEKLIRVTVKDLGDHSADIANIAIGTRVGIEGPYGAMTRHAQTRQRVLLVGAGVGVTPLRALLEDLPTNVHADVIVRASTRDELVLHDELRALAHAHGGQLFELVGSRAQVPMTPQSMRRLVPDMHHRDIYMCGPEGFMKSFSKIARTLGVPRNQIHHEEYAF